LLLFDHMKAGYAAQSLVRARKAFLDSSIEAGRRSCGDFDTLATAIASSLNSGSKSAAASRYGSSPQGLPLTPATALNLRGRS
jgi:hypothetical protein